MKTPRFRVYIREHSKIVDIASRYNDTYIMFTEDGVWWVYDTFTGENRLIASSEHDDVLMCCTGQKDKNDEYIYAGDVLSTPQRDVMFEVCFGECENAVAAFYYKSKNGRKYLMDKGCKELEIVATIDFDKQ